MVRHEIFIIFIIFIIDIWLDCSYCCCTQGEI